VEACSDGGSNAEGLKILSLVEGSNSRMETLGHQRQAG
jgi:hypothetical protein